ncbi:MAG TPA: hypothetical protein VGN23_13145 [Verrucomicrobiae bacterium]|jgi:hypothetical protein
MKDILTKLGLPETAAETEAVAAIDNLQKQISVSEAAKQKELRIRRKMAEACGALTYEAAREIVERDDAAKS